MFTVGDDNSCTAQDEQFESAQEAIDWALQAINVPSDDQPYTIWDGELDECIAIVFQGQVYRPE